MKGSSPGGRRGRANSSCSACSSWSGLAEGTAPADEGAWAVRRLFEALARERPLLLVFEDVHWAEPTLLDLIEQLAERASGPILAVCIARPELLDERPSWAERALVLEPLAEEESVELLASLPGGDELTAEARQRIVDVTAGNPLFAEQLFAYVNERGPGVLDDVPPSLEALLESRLDLLEAEERALLQRAAVIGREFAHRALVELSPAEAAAPLSGRLFELVRMGLVRPVPGAEEAFSFHHVLVRDVAYNGLPKADRARLHERFADWLEGEPDAPDEIVGYHLEQAYRYRAELGPPNRRARQLAEDAGARLGAAGMRSARRGDLPSATNLLGRATALLPEDDAWRRELLCELGVVFSAAGRNAEADGSIKEALAASTQAKDSRIGHRAQLELAYVAIQRDPEGQDAVLLDVAEKATPLFEELRDDRGLSRVWLLTSWVHGGIHGHEAKREEAAERALIHYRRAGFPPGVCLGQIVAALYYGPAPVGRAVSRCEEFLVDEASGPLGRANIDRYLGGLLAMTGAIAEGRELVSQAAATLDDLGQTGAARYCNAIVADIEVLAGDVPAARRALESLCAYCRDSEDVGLLGTAACWLVDVIYEDGDYEASERWLETARTYADPGDLLSQIAWRSASAKLLAREGQADADAMSQEAVRRAQATDALNARAAALMARAEVLRLMDRPDDADEAVVQALALYEQKENVAAAARAAADSEAKGPSRSLSP